MIIVYILFGIIILQSAMHYKERKDLYNRLMCKDANEYQSMSGIAKKKVKSRCRNVMDRWRGIGGGKE